MATPARRDHGPSSSRRSSRRRWAALITIALLPSLRAAADEGQGAATVAAGDPEAARIARMAARLKGGFLLFDQSITPDVLDRGAQQSAVPSYQWWFSLRPRYYLTPKVSLRARLDLTLEWLNAVDTTRHREPVFGDIWTDVAYRLPDLWGVEATVSLRLIWPTSKESIADGTYFRVGPVASLSRTFGLRRAGEIELSLLLYGLYNVAGHASSGVERPYSCATTDYTPIACTQGGGRMNAEVSLVALAFARYAPTPKLSFNLLYGVLDSWAHDTPDVVLRDQTAGTVTVPRSPDDQRLRQSGWLMANIDYDVRPWLSLSLGYYCLRSVVDPDGRYGNPFYAPGGATRIFFSTTFNIDRVYEAAALRVRRGR